MLVWVTLKTTTPLVVNPGPRCPVNPGGVELPVLCLRKIRELFRSQSLVFMEGPYVTPAGRLHVKGLSLVDQGPGPWSKDGGTSHHPHEPVLYVAREEIWSTCRLQLLNICVCPAAPDIAVFQQIVRAR
jgi:hypothetical protein